MLTSNESEKIDRVYSWLEDEESKFIFKHRRRFGCDNEYWHIGEIVDRYVKELASNKWYPGKDEEMIWLVRETRKNVIVFGAGIKGRRVVELCNKAGIKVDYFCDNNCKLHYNEIEGILVLPVEELKRRRLWEEHIIIVSPMYGYEEIVDSLLVQGCPEAHLYKYADYTQITLEQKQYFDDNLLCFREGEVFVDGGCYDFGTSRILLDKIGKLGFCCKKIYAFEPDKTNFDKCVRRIKETGFDDVELIQAGLWSSNAYVQFEALGSNASHIIAEKEEIEEKVRVVALDFQITEKITFIKMDIEGAELEALKGAKNLLQRYKPKLAICIYHKKEDLWEIPYYLKTLVPEYKLYIRHYSNCECDSVLYAV